MQLVSRNDAIILSKFSSVHLLHTLLLETNDIFYSISLSVAKEYKVYKVCANGPQEQVRTTETWRFFSCGTFIYFFTLQCTSQP